MREVSPQGQVCFFVQRHVVHHQLRTDRAGRLRRPSPFAVVPSSRRESQLDILDVGVRLCEVSDGVWESLAGFFSTFGGELEVEVRHEVAIGKRTQ